mmetsp:Transcript_107859/g.322545  ORF Transcript_107859/g.322545 Transcript_107859/m.322545 type:complete len:252 (-) Transcript_107859:348-1103(-)
MATARGRTASSPVRILVAFGRTSFIWRVRVSLRLRHAAVPLETVRLALPPRWRSRTKVLHPPEQPAVGLQLVWMPNSASVPEGCLHSRHQLLRTALCLVHLVPALLLKGCILQYPKHKDAGVALCDAAASPKQLQSSHAAAPRRGKVSHLQARLREAGVQAPRTRHGRGPLQKQGLARLEATPRLHQAAVCRSQHPHTTAPWCLQVSLGQVYTSARHVGLPAVGRCLAAHGAQDLCGLEKPLAARRCPRCI